MEQLHGHRRRAADRRFQALDVPPGDRRLQKRRIDGRNAGERGDAKMLDQRPEVRDHALAAIALRRRHDHMRALRPGRETGHQLAVHVKERQAAEDRLAGAEAILVEAGHRPGVERFGDMRAPGDLRRTRRAAGAEVGGDGLGLGRLKLQGVARRLLQFAAKIEHGNVQVGGLALERTCGAPALRRRTGRAPCRQSSTARRFVEPPAAAVAFLPKIGAGRRGERHQKLRLDRLQKPRQLLRLKQRTDREGDARGFAAPDRQMRFRQVRQDEGDRVVALDPEATKEIARLGDAPEAARGATRPSPL